MTITEIASDPHLDADHPTNGVPIPRLSTPFAIPVQDAADNPPIIDPGLTTQVRQYRLNHRPLHVIQPKLLRHGPPPDYSELEQP